MNVAVSAESTVDLSKELLKEFDIKTIPFTVLLGDRIALDGEISSEEIFDYVSESKNLPKTSAVNQTQYDEYFSDLLNEHDYVIHFTLSSYLSSAYNNAVNSSKNFNGKVLVIDSKTLSTGIALLAIYARKLVNAGEDVKSVYDKCLKRVPYVQASFELKQLDYLCKGGRCSALVCYGANLLKIRPQIIVKDGKMISGKKYRGNMERVVSQYCQDILSEYVNPDLDVAFLTYSTASEEMIEIAYKMLKERGFKNIYITKAGATISSHCGENCLGILFLNDGEHKI